MFQKTHFFPLASLAMFDEVFQIKENNSSKTPSLRTSYWISEILTKRPLSGGKVSRTSKAPGPQSTFQFDGARQASEISMVLHHFSFS